MLNTNYADLSFLFTIDQGKQSNEHLACEYLAVLETDHATPYYLNLHDHDVAHTLILGYTGSGKSFLLNFLIQNLQKYEPLTYIFDLGGSYERLTQIFGGSYLNIGLESRVFTINPFCLEPSLESLNFLYLFAKVLIEGNGKYELTGQDEKGLYAGVERMYKLEPEGRTLTNFASMLGPLGERLHRWTRAGQFGYVFDNEEDTLTFSRFQTFNFDGMQQYPDVLEPLLFYILHRASNQIEDLALTTTFKAFILDEAWIFLRNRTIRDYITRAEKAWRKKNAAITCRAEKGTYRTPNKFAFCSPSSLLPLYRAAQSRSPLPGGTAIGQLPTRLHTTPTPMAELPASFQLLSATLSARSAAEASPTSAPNCM